MILITFVQFYQLSAQNAPCAFDEILQSQMEDPISSEQMEVNEYEMQEMMENTPQAVMNGEAYTIPVVFHVIHTGEPVGVGSNISDSRLLQALADLNNEFRNGLNDVGIEFCLAERSPLGASSSGINRVNGSGVFYYTTVGITSNNEIQVKALSNWPNTDYVNIWIVHAIDGTSSGALGYASFPVAGNGVDGIVLAIDATGLTSESKVIAHEMGHFFNLYHTFQGGDQTTCPSNIDCSMQGDMVCDTPPHLKVFGGCDENGTNACAGGSSNSMFVHNQMSYSNNMCRDEFTEDQIIRMRSALMVLRPSLMNSIGCEPGCTSVVASFTDNIITIQQGNTTTFTNTSTGANNYIWMVEGLQFTSTDLTYTFLSPGFIPVCLRATDGSCINEFCMLIEVQPMECPEPEVVECEYLFNGDFDLTTVPNGQSVDQLESGDVCNWEIWSSSPYFCSDFAYNSFGLNNRGAATPGSQLHNEGIATKTEMELIDGEMYELSFQYYVVRAVNNANNPTLEVGLSSSFSEDLNLGDDYILLNLENIPFDDDSNIRNERCHRYNVEYNTATHCFTYDARYGKHLYFINAGTGISATVFVKNVSVQGCGACEGPLPCAEDLNFTTELTDCTAKLTATMYDERDTDLVWNLGNGVTRTGSVVEFEYPYGGTFDVCLTLMCDPENAHTVCHEVVIPDTCNTCDTLDVVMIGMCASQDTIIADTIYTNFSFEVPNGFGPCQENELFVESAQVPIYVNSYEIIDTFPDYDLITVAIAIVLPPAYDLSLPGTTGFMTLCNEAGDVICRTFELLQSDGCDFCLPEVTSEADCDFDSANGLYSYTGSMVVSLPLAINNYIQCGFTTSEVGFEIVNTTVYQSVDTWVVDYSILSTDLNLEKISVLFCFLNGDNNLQYCAPLTITTTPCIHNPPNCVYVWDPKQMSCTEEENGDVIFSISNMTVPLQNFQLCDSGLSGIVEGGTLVVNSAVVDNAMLTFDIDIVIPAATFVSGDTTEVRLFLCNNSGNVVCFGFPYKLDCDGHSAISTFGENENAQSVKRNERFSKVYAPANYILSPNPATDRLAIFSPNFDESKERIIYMQDCMGRRVHQSRLTSNKLVINVSNFHRGIYFVSIFEDGLLVMTKKIVVFR